MPDTRRYVVHGRMPLKRTSNSGLFTTRFKEDAFFIDFSERAILFNSGARTEQSLQLPLYFVEEAYYMRNKMVDSVGFLGANRQLELYIQYALLPVLDALTLDDLRKNVLERAEVARKKFLERREHQALVDTLLLSWCDEPIILFEYDRATFNLQIKARAPLAPPVPFSARTKRGRQNYFREYEDLVTSKAVYYILSAFETLPPVQQIELTFLQMEAEPIKGLTLVDDLPEDKAAFGLKRIDPTSLPTPESEKERKAQEKAAAKKQKEEAEQLKKLSKEKKKLAFTQRDTDTFDALFDGSLPHQTPLLSVRLPRQGFMDMAKSKTSYNAKFALSQFDFRFISDEETTRIEPVESFF